MSKYSKIQIIRKFLKLKGRKPLWKIVIECLYLIKLYKAIPTHYFGRYLFKKGITNITDYIPGKIQRSFKRFFNERTAIEVLENKLFFSLYYGQFELNNPKIYMYNQHKLFIIGNKPVDIKTSEAFYDLLKSIITNNSLDSIFIKATCWTWGGSKIYKIFANQLLTDHNKIEALYEEVIKSGYLFQENILQHPEMARLNPSCINTIRMDTFIDCDGNIEIISAFQRMSIKNAFVDNHSAGGCIVKINLKTGMLLSEGYLSFPQDLGVPLLKHPVTNVVFENFQIPYFDQAKELVIKAAGYIPGLRLIGWDIGISKTGPVLIEGNTELDMALGDFSAGGYLSSPVFRKAWNELYPDKHIKN